MARALMKRPPGPRAARAATSHLGKSTQRKRLPPAAGKCKTCKKGGFLVACSFCTASFHNTEACLGDAKLQQYATGLKDPATKSELVYQPKMFLRMRRGVGVKATPDYLPPPLPAAVP